MLCVSRNTQGMLRLNILEFSNEIYLNKKLDFLLRYQGAFI